MCVIRARPAWPAAPAMPNWRLFEILLRAMLRIEYVSGFALKYFSHSTILFKSFLFAMRAGPAWPGRPAWPARLGVPGMAGRPGRLGRPCPACMFLWFCSGICYQCCLFLRCCFGIFHLCNYPALILSYACRAGLARPTGQAALAWPAAQAGHDRLVCFCGLITIL